MKIRMKIMLPTALLALVAFAACDESPVKRDYDHTSSTGNLPKGVVTYEADVYQTKVRLNGKISGYADIQDYGFICIVDTILDKAGGDLDKVLLSGAATEDNIISLKGVVDSDELSYVSENYATGQQYYFVTYAQNYDGISYGDPQLFTTGTTPYKGIYNLSSTSSQANWEAISYVLSVSKADSVRPFEYVVDAMTNTGTYISYAKKGPYSWPGLDNWLVFKSEMGCAMQFSYYVHPTSTRVTSFHERYQVLISPDSITASNYEQAEVLFDYTFAPDTAADGTLSVPDVDANTIDIPTKYEYTTAWIAIRHFDVYSLALEVESAKLY